METLIAPPETFLSALIIFTSGNADSTICVGWHMSEETVMTITQATRPQEFAVRLELPSTGMFGASSSLN